MVALVGIEHVALEVGDLDAALEFYGAIFDLGDVRRESGMAFVAIGEQFIALSEDRSRPVDGDRHFGLVVDGKDAAQAALERAGAEILPGRGLEFRDHWGNRIEIVDYRDRSRKEIVRRFVTEAVSGGRDELVEQLLAPELAEFAREWFGSFRRSFPDMEMTVVHLVAEGDTVVGRFACSGTHLGEWRGHPPTGRRFEAVPEVYVFTFAGDRIATVWGLEDTLDRFRQLGLDPRG